MKSNEFLFSSVTTVFIDLDNTLWNFSANSEKALRQVYESHAIKTLLPFYEIFREMYESRNAQLWHDYHHGLITRDYLMEERFAHVLRRVGYSGDVAAESMRLNEEYLDYLSTLPELMPGAEDLLKHLRKRGYRVVVLSNGFKGVQQRKLASAGIAALVDRVILSDDCGITKPQPGLFEYAMKECGVRPEQCLMIGDDADTDIRGAHEVGWHTIFYNVKHQEPFEGTADVEILHLDQVKDWLP